MHIVTHRSGRSVQPRYVCPESWLGLPTDSFPSVKNAEITGDFVRYSTDKYKQAWVVVHAPIGFERGFPIPLGILSFDPRVLETAREYLVDRLPQYLNRYESGNALDIHTLLNWDDIAPLNVIHEVDLNGTQTVGEVQKGEG